MSQDRKILRSIKRIATTKTRGPVARSIEEDTRIAERKATRRKND